MKFNVSLLSTIAVVAAAPIEDRAVPFQQVAAAPWNAGAVTDWQIHPSCNASQALQIRNGLEETVKLAAHAKNHVLRWGNDSAIYRKYFGNAPSIEVIGSFDLIANGDRGGALFRCDDPDGNCAPNPTTWAGHWRGNNATGETVICPLSFQIRRPLVSLCGLGYNVRQSSRVIYWASDLLHRLYHMPAFGQEYVEHYASGYDGITKAAGNSNSTHDSDGLQYFALEAYAYDIVVPGVGCPGPSGPLASATSAAAAASSSASSTSSRPATTSSTSAAATTTSSRATTSAATSTAAATAAAAATTSSLPSNCHTHADGAIHCV